MCVDCWSSIPRGAGRLVLILACVGLMSALLPPGASAQPYRVHVFASADADHEADEKARLDSVDDVRRALRDTKYRELFTLVDSAHEADLLLDVVWRGAIETSTTVTTSRPIPGASSPPLGSQQRVMQNNLRVRIAAGTHEHELLAVDPGRASRFGGMPHLGWRELANRAVERVAAWARQNRQHLERAR